MIKPTEADIGRKVIYKGIDIKEEGIVSSIGERFIHVRFTPRGPGVACPRTSLEWKEPCPSPNPQMASASPATPAAVQNSRSLPTSEEAANDLNSATIRPQPSP